MVTELLPDTDRIPHLEARQGTPALIFLRAAGRDEIFLRIILP